MGFLWERAIAIVTEALLPSRNNDDVLGVGLLLRSRRGNSKFLAQINDQHHGHGSRAQ
jgi:hypothetical protein